MSLSFVDPLYLLSVLGLVPLVYYWHRRPTSLTQDRRRIALSLRVGTILCIVLALAGAQVVSRSKNLSVVFLLDRSLSTGGNSLQWQSSYISAALENRGKNDQFGITLFGADTGLEYPVGTHSTTEIHTFTSVVDPQSSQLLSALRYAATTFPGDTARRLVLLSDGRSTEGDAEAEIRALSEAGIEVWICPQPDQKVKDVLLSKFESPAQINIDEPFFLRTVIESQGVSECRILITENGIPKQNLDVKLREGPNLFLLPQRKEQPGPVRYEVRIMSDDDSRLQNNKGEALTLVGGEQTVIVLRSESGPGSLVPLLEQAGLNAVALRPSELPKAAGAWKNISALIIEDVDSLSWDKRLQSVVSLLVREGGMGLMMCGSDSTFGVGAYQHTPIEDLLPVNLAIRRPKDQPLSALIQLLDKSGSMHGEPIKMAREAAIASGETLAERDYLGILGFDSAARWVVRFQPKGDGSALRRGVSTLRAGGGTDLYPALSEGIAKLKDTEAPLKHIIVLSDGAVVPADFDSLLTTANSHNITVSAVALGPGADIKFLEDITKKGKGRLFRSEDTRQGSNLAQIFIRDTVLATGSGIQDKPSDARPTLSGENSPILAGLDFKNSPKILAYNMSSTKGGTAQNLLQTSKKDPILAVGRAGLGSTAAWLSDLGGDWSKPWNSVSGASSGVSLLETVLIRTVRSIQSNESLPLSARGNQLRVTPTGSSESGSLEVSISTRKPLTGPLRVVTIGKDGRLQESTLHPQGPFQATGNVRVTEPGAGLVVVQDSEGNLMGRSNFSIPLAPEFTKLGTDFQAMRRWSQAPNSKFEPAPSEVFDPPAVPVPSRMPLEQDLVRGAILLLLLEIAVRRLPIPRAGRFASKISTSQVSQPLRDAGLSALRMKKEALDQKREEQSFSRGQSPTIERVKRPSLPRTLPKDAPPAPDSNPKENEPAQDSTLARLKKSREKNREKRQ